MAASGPDLGCYRFRLVEDLLLIVLYIQMSNLYKCLGLGWE
jgi:hypothetical protein